MQKRELENREMEKGFFCEKWMQEIIAGIEEIIYRNEE